MEIKKQVAQITFVGRILLLSAVVHAILALHLLRLHRNQQQPNIRILANHH